MNADVPIQAATWCFDATVEAPGSARAALRSFLADQVVAPDTLSSVLLCVSEAVTNAVLHAYRDAESAGDVNLEAERFDGYVCVIVRDAGQGLRPRVGSPGLGVGLPLISQMATATEIRTPESGGTEVAMRFDL